MNSKKRIYLIDEIRGISIILVVTYHFFYSAAMVFRFDWATGIFSTLRQWQPLLPITFVLLSGISFNLSKSNVKREIKLLLIGIGITIVTVTLLPSESIWFGIIHFIGIANIICGLLEKPIRKIPAFMGALFFGFLFLFTSYVPSGYLGLYPDFAIKLPDFLYTTDLTMPLGFHTKAFMSADYNPIIPWIFLFISGICLGKHIKRLPKILCKQHIKALAFTGRHTLIIYLAHQPIIIGLLYLINLIH